MHQNKPLSASEIELALVNLPEWSHHDNCLVKEFSFDSFRNAIAFIVRLSFEAEELNHHPELGNVYNRVSISLTTHDAGNVVTETDIDLALAIEKFA